MQMITSVIFVYMLTPIFSQTGLKEKLTEQFSPPALISTAINDETTRSNFSPPAKTSTTINDTNIGYCYSSEWTCTTGQCIDIGHRCDGTDQCADISDERNCCQLFYFLNIKK
ncbi:low-density lipoprotein receptor-related protein 2 [Biomphalaria pfeifferi]|uniref:Low-density lipoprotein receptor-related protein 2 n=1 Tax=Biomphalaria pfeifferi TaxID=112525 RepID=A0AAD8AYU1_BIOPF|nr:low-density lipoprotein receptor-related protein 2 [Biomphalaria pfeifferi]